MQHKLGRAFWDILLTHSAAGAAADADNTPTLKVYKEGADLGLTTPTKYEVTSITGDGRYKYWIDWTTENGFEIGKLYSIVLTAVMSGTTRNTRVGPILCVAKDIDDLKDFDPAASEVDLGKVKGVALTEDSGGNLAANFSEVFNNDDAITTKVCDDIGGAAANHPEMLLDTDIDTVTDQTHFILTAGANDDDAYLNQGVVVYDASESDSPSVRTVTAYDSGTLTITLDEAPDFTAVSGDGIKIFVTPPGSTCPTAAQNADAVCDELLADHDDADSVGNALHTIRNHVAGTQHFDIANGDQIIMEDDGETERIRRRNVEVDATTTGMVPQ